MTACGGLTIRPALPDDHQRVMAVMPDWWGGRDLRPMLPRIFFEHFRRTILIAEHDRLLVGFLVGFLCPDHDDEAYVHFAGVRPDWRRSGLGADLYRRFFAIARAAGRRTVRAVTSPVNTGSIAFHTGIGFTVLPGDLEIDGVPVVAESGPHGDHLVRFELRLDQSDAEVRA
jgi:ribosomal protein S18 acetylase RimI-like enzyme